MPTITLDGLRLAYTDEGHGVTIIFVPGLCGSREWFHYQSTGLSKQFRIVATDLRPARKADYSLELLACDIYKLLLHLHVPAAIVAGHGLGALVGLRFALDYPERCSALVLSSGCPTFRSVSAEQLISDMFVGQLARSNLWSRILSFLRLERGSNRYEDTTDPLGFLAANNGAPDRQTLDARVRLMREADLSPVLSRVRAPALIVAGSNEPDYILSGCQTLYEELLDASMEIIEGADHYHFFLRYDQFNSILEEFVLDRVTPP
ncbi:MAG: alpha/beta hydrolase [Armatimonadota bacterium]|nr:alpha/beta hydrolase [Armatimonadota bacterium]